LVRRSLVQVLAALAMNPHLSNLLTGKLYRGPGKYACVPGLNCYSCPAATGACPLGALQSALSGVMPRFPAYVLGFMLLMALVGGRAICGWLCPFGWLQELVHRLPGPKPGKSPLTRRLAQLKYYLAPLLVIILPLALWWLKGVGEPFFCKYICPAGTLEGAVPLLLASPRLRAAAGWLTAWKFALLALLLVLAAIYFRPFCRWLCPLGSFYGLMSRYSLLGVEVDADRCTHCGACTKSCKMDITVAGDKDCIACGECLSKCPEQAISFKSLRRKTK